MFTLFFGAMALFVLIAIFFGFYIFCSYVLSRLGEKFRVGSFIQFLIPIYNVMLLCDCAGITRWLTVAIIAPGIVASALNLIGFVVADNIIKSVGALIGFAANVWLWGNIAHRLGKNFWLWGIITPVLLGFPVLILAFDGSMPMRENRTGTGTRVTMEGETKYIDV